MIPDLHCLALLAAYRAGSLHPADVIEHVLSIIDACQDGAVWITRVPAEAARARAQALDGRHHDPGLTLFGIPFAVKDNIDVAGMPTTAGCPDYAYMPARNATVVQKLLDAGAILLGKTNMDQFATGLVGTRSPFGAPRCVFDSNYISGGSSSGSAVAVAGGLVSFALGTDTAGSGRVPASINNLIGMKPSRGRISTHGVVPACRSLDCVSILALDAADAAAVLAVASGRDLADPWSRQLEEQALPADRPLRFAVLSAPDRDFDGDDAAAVLYQAAIDALAASGAMPVPSDYAVFRETAALLYDGPFVAERRSILGAFFDSNPSAIDPSVYHVVDGARRYSAADMFDGLSRLQQLRAAADIQWRQFDVMLLPTCATIPTVAEVAADPFARNSMLGRYTNFVNLLDYAAVNVPAGFRSSNGLPFGVSLIGTAGSDLALLNIGDQLHRLLGAGAGYARQPPGSMPMVQSAFHDIEPARREIDIVVAGAHMSGMPLNHQLTDLGASFLRPARTASDYRFFALATEPPKPGLVHAPGYEGAGIEVEIWRLSASGFGIFVASLPSPMAICKIRLSDGSVSSGFTCESWATTDAKDISWSGGWRAYRAAGTVVSKADDTAI